MIKIALTDDEALFRKGMRALIEDFEDMEVIAEAAGGDSLLHILGTSPVLPDVLLLDLNMANLNGIETAKILQTSYPAIHVIILSSYFSKAFVINLIEIGATSYLPKNAQPEEVERTIREVVAKGYSYNDAVMQIIRDNMVQKNRPKIKTPFKITLTNREQEVLELICNQATTAEIAKKLFISTRTVEGHRNNLLQKLGCRNTAGLVVFALQHQLVQINPNMFGFDGG